jgi:phosphocarrier protein HPr
MISNFLRRRKNNVLSQELTIVNKLGLHARAAAKLVRLASTYKSDVSIERGSRKVNAKSIMGVMLLAAGKGTKINLIVDGDDEHDAMKKLADLINSGFGEEDDE